MKQTIYLSRSYISYLTKLLYAQPDREYAELEVTIVNNEVTNLDVIESIQFDE